MTMVLVIGDKKYSSWSLRPWLAMRHIGLPFEEVKITLRQPDTRIRILPHSPSGKVPVLKHDGVRVWESLAILEYIADLMPEAGLWPDDPQVRGEARAASMEMHAGFIALRNDMPMDCNEIRTVDPSQATLVDIQRIIDLWCECRDRYASDGAFLFGRFGAADAMYAPVVSRFVTYGVELPPLAAAYRDAMTSLPAYRDWHDGAAAED